MPSKSRKKIKGQARRARAKASAATSVVNNNNNAQHEACSFTIEDNGTLSSTPNNSMICSHGHQLNEIPHVVGQFINTFFTSFYTVVQETTFSTDADMILTLVRSLAATYNIFPEALNKVGNRSIVKKNIVSNGVSYLLKESAGPSYMPLACAVTLMLIDTYDPSSPVRAGVFDEGDAKAWLKREDIINGCQRSLIKYFVKCAPCKCLDDLYSQIKSGTPKMSKCVGCRQTKDRNSMFICTRCERVTYCSKLCQIAHVPHHKDMCKRWQSGRYTYDR